MNISTIKVKLQCNGCHGPTWHVLQANSTVEGEEDLGEGHFEPWSNCFEIFRCQGCDALLVQRSFYFALIGEEPEVSYFPPRISRHQPNWSWDLPSEIRDLLKEVYGALQADSPRLALMGIRAVVDVAILNKVGDVGSFVEKLAALEKQGFVGRKQSSFLGAVLDAGNAAAHRGHVATDKELNFAMDIVENLLQAVYALEDAAQHLQAKTPPRQRQSKAGNEPQTASSDVDRTP